MRTNDPGTRDSSQGRVGCFRCHYGKKYAGGSINARGYSSASSSLSGRNASGNVRLNKISGGALKIALKKDVREKFNKASLFS